MYTYLTLDSFYFVQGIVEILSTLVYVVSD